MGKIGIKKPRPRARVDSGQQKKRGLMDEDLSAIELFESVYGQVRSLSDIRNDVQLDHLGYKCKGKLCDLPFYERMGVWERLWLWEKEGSPAVVTIDLCNGWCKVVELKDVKNWNYEKWFDHIMGPRE